MGMCSVAWGAFGVLSIATPEALPTAAHRYLCTLLATVTICSMMVYLSARIVRTIRAAEPAQTDDGYAAGYTDGLDASHARSNGARVAQMPPRGLIRS